MNTSYDASPYVPDDGDLARLRKAAAECEGCPLHQDATQTVFGEGDRHARVLLLGEEPGDQEDRKGKPFVGPAGRLLDRALAEAGIDRAIVATLHPSAVLRANDRDAAYAGLVTDLKVVAKLLAS